MTLVQVKGASLWELCKHPGYKSQILDEQICSPWPRSNTEIPYCKLNPELQFHDNWKTNLTEKQTEFLYSSDDYWSSMNTAKVLFYTFFDWSFTHHQNNNGANPQCTRHYGLRTGTKLSFLALCGWGFSAVNRSRQLILQEKSGPYDYEIYF